MAPNKRKRKQYTTGLEVATRTTFSKKEEKDLICIVNARSSLERGINRNRIRRLGYQYAIAKGIDIPSAWHEAKLAGLGWCRYFLIRHQTSLLLNEVALKSYTEEMGEAAVELISSIPDFDPFEDLLEDVSRKQKEDTNHAKTSKTSNGITYRRPRRKAIRDKSVMLKAVKDILFNNCTFSETSKKYNIPTSTLHSNVRSYNTVSSIGQNKNRDLFSLENERGMVEYIKNSKEENAIFTKREIRKLIYEYAKLQKIPIPRKWEFKGMANIDWTLHILQKYKDQLRVQVATGKRKYCRIPFHNRSPPPNDDDISEESYFETCSAENANGSKVGERSNSNSECLTIEEDSYPSTFESKYKMEVDYYEESSVDLDNENVLPQSEELESSNSKYYANQNNFDYSPLESKDNIIEQHYHEDLSMNVDNLNEQQKSDNHKNSKSKYFTIEENYTHDNVEVENIIYFPACKEEDTEKVLEKNLDNEETIFNDEEEEKLVIFINALNERKTKKSLTATRAGQLAYEFAKRLDKPYPKIWDDSRSVPLKWMINFICRHREKLGLTKNSSNNIEEKIEEAIRVLRLVSLRYKKNCSNFHDFEQAVIGIIVGDYTYKEASTLYNISTSTLHDHVKAVFQKSISLKSVMNNYEIRPFLTNDEEKLLVQYINESAIENDGLTTNNLRKVIYTFVKINEASYPEIWNNFEMASSNWTKNFTEKYGSNLNLNPQLTFCRVIKKNSTDLFKKLEGKNKFNVDSFSDSSEDS